MDFIQDYIQSIIDGDTGALIGLIAAVLSIAVVLFGLIKWLIDKSRKRTPGEVLGRIEKNTKDLADKVEGGAGAYQSSRAITDKLVEQSKLAARAHDKASGLELDNQAKQQEIEALTRTIEELKAGAQEDRPGMEEALAALECGETDKAAALFDRIAEARIAEGAAANSEAAHALRNKGNLLFLHDTQGAMRAYAKATELDPDDPVGWNRFGQLQARVGELDAAEQSFGHVLALGNSMNDKEWQARAIGNLGLIYQTQGNLTRAETMFKRDLELSEELGSKEGQARATGNLGVNYGR